MHSIEIKVRGYHLDLYGHVNNARYLEFLEEARWGYFEDTIGLDRFVASGLAFVVVNININYRRPAYMNETIQVQTWVKSVSNRSAVVAQRIVLKETDALISEADITFVLLDEKQQKATTLTGEIRTALESLIESAPQPA